MTASCSKMKNYFRLLFFPGWKAILDCSLFQDKEYFRLLSIPRWKTTLDFSLSKDEEPTYIACFLFQDEKLHQELPVPSQENRRLLSCALPFHLRPVQLHVLELLHDQTTGEIDPSPSPLPLPPPSSPIHLEKKPKRIAVSILNPLGVLSKNSIMSAIVLEKVDMKKQSSAAATKYFGQQAEGISETHRLEFCN